MEKSVCLDCQHDWESEETEKEPIACPNCGSKNIVHLDPILEE